MSTATDVDALWNIKWIKNITSICKLNLRSVISLQWIEILPTFLGHPNAAQFCLNLFRSSLWPYVKRIISVEYVKGKFLENTNTWKKNPNSVFYSILQISTLENELLTKPYYCMTYYGIINCSWPVPSIKKTHALGLAPRCSLNLPIRWRIFLLPTMTGFVELSLWVSELVGLYIVMQVNYTQNILKRIEIFSIWN